jgi:predicted enzyme related to lactoylglutathione lyase
MGETNEGVIGVTVWTDDLERLLGFYRDTLGLRLRSRKGDWANFEWGSLRLNLGLHGGVKGRANDPYRIMITFGVSGIHDEYHRLKGQGVEFIRVPEQEHWGGWVATFLDPDGNILQMMQKQGRFS